jgi:hypothetical protein
MKVQNMTGRSGKPVANQFMLEGYQDRADKNGEIRPMLCFVFQSYKTIICEENNYTGRITLDRDKWDYSTTTGKYRNQFLGETKKETQAKIDSGEYILADLN